MLTVRIFAGSAQRLAGSCAHPHRDPAYVVGVWVSPAHEQMGVSCTLADVRGIPSSLDRTNV